MDLYCCNAQVGAKPQIYLFIHTFLILERSNTIVVDILLFGHKSKPQVDLGDLKTEKDNLISFLQVTLKAPTTLIGNKLTIESETVSPQELQRIVTKFIYKRNINNTYYVSLDGSTVKVNIFKGADKKAEKEKKSGMHQTAAQSWGL